MGIEVQHIWMGQGWDSLSQGGLYLQDNFWSFSNVMYSRLEIWKGKQMPPLIPSMNYVQSQTRHMSKWAMDEISVSGVLHEDRWLPKDKVTSKTSLVYGRMSFMSKPCKDQNSCKPNSATEFQGQPVQASFLHAGNKPSQWEGYRRRGTPKETTVCWRQLQAQKLQI